MKSIILGGLAAGAITVLLCTSKVGEALQCVIRKALGRSDLTRWFVGHVDYLMACTFCMSWWISLAMLDKFSITEWAATVSVANVTVLLIHWSLTTEQEDDKS